MGEVRVRNLDGNVVEALKRRAKRNGHSLEAELRGLLTDEARRPKRELIDRLQELRDSIRAESGELPDSTPGIRAEREKRW
ncbi:MAG TPA: hypothetical protein VG269_29365 [Tepidisphaeraceae bacterium]|jgi:plasmid stability protein|nr:hypothetical protein [Tepidisphaeraceae bacterium]